MNDGFSFDSSITCSELFRVSLVNLGYIAGDRRRNLKPKFAQVPEQSEFYLWRLLSSCRAPLTFNPFAHCTPQDSIAAAASSDAAAAEIAVQRARNIAQVRMYMCMCIHLLAG